MFKEKTFESYDSGIVPKIDPTFPFWMAMLIRWIKNDVARFSFLASYGTCHKYFWILTDSDQPRSMYMACFHQGFFLNKINIFLKRWDIGDDTANEPIF